MQPFLDGWPNLLTVFAVAGALAIVTVCLGWKGSDFPAQVFRTELVRQDGFVLWNSQWFGGHPMLSYSVLSPILGAFTGPIALNAISMVVSTVLFERILRFAFGRASLVGALWFAVASATNLIVGRMTFGLGVALGLGAVLALQRRLPVIAVALALLCSLSSPLAGAFLAIAAAAWACARRDERLPALIVVATSLAPIALIAMLFPNPGSEPYEPWAFAWDLGVCVALVLASRRVPELRWGAAFYGCAAVTAFVVPSALGGNISRLGQFVAGPLLACALLPRRRLALIAVAVPLLIWQAYPAIDGIAYARTDPSIHESYYTPLLNYLGARDHTIGRVEIPSTYRHWEAAYVAPHVLLARGWERQLDIAYNHIFYEKGALTADSFRTWLTTNGVAYVALPDTRLDDSSTAEAALLNANLPYLHLTWHDAHWKVWRVEGFRGLVEGPAQLVNLSPDRLTVDVQGPGDVLVRVRATRHWNVVGTGCATATSDGWTLLRDLPRGIVEVTQALRGSRCSDAGS